ncbi:hypothetical protein GTP23_17140 [Pseudoduganella sp. FT93W]|uniref:Uncharacterized protein n=1 Tax=Duganella fentianensis TaxID=2692177 RepID=A0A845HZX1_9BURK|nr:hypothetical protein [Duganella fentianensis]MYN46770.1 hypothetical protein [Duganella fentianensis]
MTNDMKTKAKRSDATRALIQQKALAQGSQRSDEVQARVRAVMKSIEAEIAENEGVYPHNEGAVSGAEVARRADIHPTTLYSKKQRELGIEVGNWLKRLKATEPIGRGAAKKKLVTRIADWKQLFENLKQSYRDTELDLQQTQADLAESLKTIQLLREENANLRALLEKSGAEKIAVLRPKKT